MYSHTFVCPFFPFYFITCLFELLVFNWSCCEKAAKQVNFNYSNVKCEKNVIFLGQKEPKVRSVCNIFSFSNKYVCADPLFYLQMNVKGNSLCTYIYVYVNETYARRRSTSSKKLKAVKSRFCWDIAKENYLNFIELINIAVIISNKMEGSAFVPLVRGRCYLRLLLDLQC